MCEKIVCVFYVWETGNASMEQEEEEEDNKEGIVVTFGMCNVCMMHDYFNIKIL